MGTSSNMPCYALVVLLDLPKLYFGAWGNNYTFDPPPPLSFLIKKKKPLIEWPSLPKSAYHIEIHGCKQSLRF